MFAVLDPAVLVAHQIVDGLMSVLTHLLGHLAALVALVVFTMLVRTCLIPLSYAAAQGAQARAALAPQLRALQRRHQGDAVRLHKETTDLYRSHGVSPFTGILPALAQVPLFAVMYRLCTIPTVGTHANLLLTHSVFGVPLGGSLVTAGGLTGGLLPVVLVYCGLFVLLGVVAWWSSRLTRRTLPEETPALVARLVRLLPYATLVVAAFVPLAAGFYVLVSTAWSTVERAAFGVPRPVRPAAG
jgi:YidC/Oxa1 family membrane protein insertase